MSKLQRASRLASALPNVKLSSTVVSWELSILLAASSANSAASVLRSEKVLINSYLDIPWPLELVGRSEQNGG